MRVIYANYSVSESFKIPKSIPLLSVEENKVSEPIAWSWWVRWGILHYYDADLNEHELEPDFPASDYDYKRPDEIKEDEEESDDEE